MCSSIVLSAWFQHTIIEATPKNMDSVTFNRIT